MGQTDDSEQARAQKNFLFGTLWAVFSEAITRLVADEAVPLAGNIAYRTLLAVFPFLIFLTAMAGFLGNEQLAQTVVDFLLEVAPKELVDPISPEIRFVLTNARADLLSVGILLTLWVASAGVDGVRVSLNRAYEFKEHRSILVLYTQNILFVFGAVFVLLVLALGIVLAPVMIATINRYIPDLKPVSDLFNLARYPLAVIVLAVGLFAAHLVLPARWIPLRDLWPGVFLTVLVWVALAGIYSVYLARFSTFASTYASLAGIIAALIFVYFSALALIFGGEINRALKLHREGRSSSDSE